MTEATWTAVEHTSPIGFFSQIRYGDAALEENAKAGLPATNISSNIGKLLQLPARVQGARKMLEIGTLGGNYRGATPTEAIQRSVEHDRWYIANRSLSLDFWILL